MITSIMFKRCKSLLIFPFIVFTVLCVEMSGVAVIVLLEVSGEAVIVFLEMSCEAAIVSLEISA